MRFVCFLILLIFIVGCGTSTVVDQKSSDIIDNYSGCAIGAFVNGMENISSFQSMIGRNLAVVLWYVHWEDPFPTADANTVYNNGSVPLITWEPWIAHPLGTLEAIASGSFESYVTSFMRSARDWGGPVLLRFAHEMNGDWYPWAGNHNGAGPEAAESYKRAWAYIYDVKKTLKADNVYLVWTPNNENIPDAYWNTPEAYYPGDEYVDWIGMDGYNWGDADWLSFDAVFGGIYSALTALANKPLMIGEFAAAEEGGDKSAWITDAFSRLQSNYPRIKLFCWFNINKERDWRINSSASSEAAFKLSLQSGYFLDRIRNGN